MNKKFEFFAQGHQNILGTHTKTLEFTKEDYLTERGNCIIGIKCNISCSNLPDWLKLEIHNEKKFLIQLKIGYILNNNGDFSFHSEENKLCDEFIGYGNKKLTLKSNISMVFRKSNFICDRTVLIKCTKCAAEINRELIKKMKNPNSILLISIEVLN